MLADAEMQIAAGRRAGLDLAGTAELERRLGGGIETGGAADQPRVMVANRVEPLAAGLAGGNALRIGLESRNFRIPTSRHFAPLHGFELPCEVRITLAVRLEHARPFGMQVMAALANPVAKLVVNAVRHEEFCLLRPTVAALGEPHLVFTERLAMGGAR